MKRNRPFILLILMMAPVLVQSPANAQPDEILAMMHSISSHACVAAVEELTGEKYGGRLTGTPGYDLAADWVAGRLKEYGFEPLGDSGTYFQRFPVDYTLVNEDCRLSLVIPLRGGAFRRFRPVG